MAYPNDFLILEELTSTKGITMGDDDGFHGMMENFALSAASGLPYRAPDAVIRPSVQRLVAPLTRAENTISPAVKKSADDLIASLISSDDDEEPAPVLAKRFTLDPPPHSPTLELYEGTSYGDLDDYQKQRLEELDTEYLRLIREEGMEPMEAHKAVYRHGENQ